MNEIIESGCKAPNIKQSVDHHKVWRHILALYYYIFLMNSAENVMVDEYTIQR